MWELATGAELCSIRAKDGVRSCAVAPDGVTIVAGDRRGGVHFLRLENLAPGPPLCTAWLTADSAMPAAWWRLWREREDALRAFVCLHCLVWSEVAPSALGAELPCPKWGKAV